jgi:hypothetical protein
MLEFPFLERLWMVSFNVGKESYIVTLVTGGCPGHLLMINLSHPVVSLSFPPFHASGYVPIDTPAP